MYLDSESRSTLVTHSQKLASYSTIEAWRSSPYGTTIRMGTKHTFDQLRRYWELYADFYDPSKSQRFQFLQKAMERKRNTVLREHGYAVHFSSSRSSGPFIAEPPVVMLVSEQFEQYWKTGTTFTDTGLVKASTHPNATFFHLRADEGFDVHYSTDPMVPFHHAPLFVDPSRTVTIKDLVESAKSEFREWCSAFRSAAATTKADKAALVVRFLLGDPLAVSRALQVLPLNDTARTKRTHIEQWTACTVDLDRVEYADHAAPVRFDVVDTAKLSDDVGMHNVFLCAAPLLNGSPAAVLYTESLLARKADPLADFQAKLFADLSVIALLLDLAPVDALSGFTTRCNTHELSMAQMTMPVAMSLDKQQCHQVLAWKRPTSGDTSASPLGIVCPPLSFDVQDFARLLHKIYLHLFEHEDPGYVKTHSYRANPALVKEWASSWCPSRESFVMLLALIGARARIQDTQWSALMAAFLDIQSDDALGRRPFDALSHHEIHAQLYRYGLHTVPELDQPSSPAAGRLSHWPLVPPLVRIFLTVPRTNLAKLKSVSEKLPAPWLHCTVKLPRSGTEHTFQSVDAFYGTVVNSTTAATDISIVEDTDAPTAVFSFVVPGSVLADRFKSDSEPRDSGVPLVRLAARATPMATKILTPVLGKDLTIFAASLDDADHVHLAPEQQLSPKPFEQIVPTENDSTRGSNLNTSSITAIGVQSLVHATLDVAGTRERVTSLTARLDIEDAEAKGSVEEGATPHISQVSPCAMRVAFGSLAQTLVYPLPVVGSQRRVRIARKSSYIEVVVPVGIPFLQPDGYKMDPFPVVHVGQALAAWNLHRVPLERLPVLNITPSNAAAVAKWYNPHVVSQMSARESAFTLRVPKQRDTVDSDVLASIKDTIYSIMVHSASPSTQARGAVFALHEGSEASTSPGMLLFVDKLRLDVAAHTVVCDAFVLPLLGSPDCMRAIRPLLVQLLASDRPQGVTNIRMHGGETEMRVWRLLLPALVERCRTSWTHGANCECAATGKIPLELERDGGGDPLCSCGRGKDVDGMLMSKEELWKGFAPFVTRVALSPLFAVSYVDPVLGGREDDDDLPAQVGAPASRPGRKARSAGGTAEVARCDRCRKEESSAVKLLRCSGCRTVSYCSEACQKSDWKAHKR
ncbi:hypothetical protein GSI_10221 [Ganoderma sinense ZZ0214-1]|uniref:MYND-type domain-containing protein n=1 Tax=Ganoderma sinense ZZ0214-1 TaxID=1077348 RepID=A0A2G8RZZ0_9APHY|nr:hypothetical protein GSI_10221 [Ganoderma sinense ZZ0214-1]